jgi:hypothetical protein
VSRIVSAWRLAGSRQIARDHERGRCSEPTRGGEADRIRPRSRRASN